MDPHANVAFGGGPSESTISPIGLVAMTIAMVLILVLPRKWAIVPFLLFTFLVPLEQFNVGGLHLFAHRLVVLCGCLRLLVKSFSAKRIFAGGFNGIDKIFLVWAFCRVTAFVLYYQVGAAVVNQVGFLWDTVAGYLLLRYLIRNTSDIRRIAKVLVVIAVIMAGCMLYEQYHVKNLFALLMGGTVVPNIRNGHIRSRGVFEQEIIASTFGGTLVPLFIWLWSTSKAKVAAVLGLISSVVITVTASSSTGIAAAGVGIGTLCLWRFRKHTRKILLGFVAAIVGLACVMKAPVWFVLARVDLAGGSTGWDRANLIDQCVKHFSSWWLLGTADNVNWGFDTWDLCNQFVAEAVQGGLATLILFLVLIYLCFHAIGRARQTTHDRAQEWLLWTLGCILCAHLAGFFGISYFDQMKYWWFATLAMIPASSIAAPAVARMKKKSSQAEMEYTVPEIVDSTFDEESAVSTSRQLFG